MNVRSRMTFVCLVALVALMAASGPALSQTVTDVEPDEVRRGTSTSVLLTGTDLDLVDSVTAADRVDVSIVGQTSVSLSLSVSPGDRAVAGLRDLVLVVDGGDDGLATDAITVIAGDPMLIQLTPNSLLRGASEEVSITGENLDAATGIEIVDGVVITDFEVSVTDPTRATATVTVESTAVAGLHDVTALSTEVNDVLPNGFTVVPGALSAAGLDPASIMRGETLTLTLTGENLDLIDSVDMGVGMTLDSTNLVSATDLELTVSARNDSLPVGAARDLIFSGSDDSTELEDGLTVTAGSPTITRVRPDRVSQRSSTELSIDGTNLDGVFRIDAGPGTTPRDLDAISPVRFVMVLDVADDAEPGLRSLEAEGAHGIVILDDAFQILTRVIPPPAINYPDILDLGHVEVGARKRVSMTFTNQNDVDETVRLDLVSGDITEFRLIDAEGETLTDYFLSEMEFELPALGELNITAEYRPSIAATSSATVMVEVRGEEYGGLQLRGTGDASTLNFAPQPPINIPSVTEGEEVGFAQLSSLTLGDERVVIEGTEVLVEQNDGPFDDADTLTEIVLSDPLPPETELLFGATLLTVRVAYPPGIYEGEIWVYTDLSTAPIMPIVFSTSINPAPVDDVGAGDDPDNDMGEDLTDDVTAPDADLSDVPLADTGTPPDTGGGDTGDLGEDDSGGCCSQASGPAPAGAPLLLALGLAMLCSRRRR